MCIALRSQRINDAGDRDSTGLNSPGVASAQEFSKVAAAALRLHIGNLLVDDVFVAGKIVPGTENADGSGEAFAVLHMGEQKRVRGTRMMRVVNDQVGFGDAVAELDYFDVAVRLAADSFVAIPTEDERLAMLEL